MLAHILVTSLTCTNDLVSYGFTTALPSYTWFYIPLGILFCILW